MHTITYMIIIGYFVGKHDKTSYFLLPTFLKALFLSAPKSEKFIRLAYFVSKTCLAISTAARASRA